MEICGEHVMFTADEFDDIIRWIDFVVEDYETMSDLVFDKWCKNKNPNHTDGISGYGYISVIKTVKTMFFVAKRFNKPDLVLSKDQLEIKNSYNTCIYEDVLDLLTIGFCGRDAGAINQQFAVNVRGF